MMPGAAGEQRDRNRDLFPDKRVVLRPVANTEAVFGELDNKQRRPRTKRGQQEQVSDGESNG